MFSWVLKEALNDFTNGFGEACKGSPPGVGVPTKGAVPASFCLLSHLLVFQGCHKSWPPLKLLNFNILSTMWTRLDAVRVLEGVGT